MGIRFIDREPPKERRKVKFSRPSPLTLQQRVHQEQLKVQREESPIKSGVFPRLTESELGIRKSKEVSTALDLLSLPGRTLAATLGRDKDEEFLESLAKIEDDGFLWDIIRNPATGATVLTLPAGGAAGVAAKSLPKLQQLSTLTGIGLAEGLVGAGTSQIERVTGGEEFQPGQFALETGVSAAVPFGQKLIGGLIRGGNKLFGKIASEATGIPEEALKAFAKKGGPQALKKAAGTELEIGLEVLDVMKNFDDFIPERQLVKEALQEMPPINLADLKIFIERQKIKPIKGFKISKADKAVNNELNELINRFTDDPLKSTKGFIDPTTKEISFREVAKNVPLDKEVAAVNYKKFRQSIDRGINYKKIHEIGGSDILNNKMFKIRTYMKNKLIESAKIADPNGTLGYEDGMNAWSEKLRLVESLDDVLGGKLVNQQQKAANLIGNIYSKSNKVKFRLIKKLDDITNKNFLGRSALAEMAEKLGPEGVPGILPPQRTGASLKGIAAGSATGSPLLGFGVSSPRAASAGIGTLNLLQQGMQAPQTGTLGGIITREALRGE